MNDILELTVKTSEFQNCTQLADQSIACNTNL